MMRRCNGVPFSDPLFFFGGVDSVGACWVGNTIMLAIFPGSKITVSKLDLPKKLGQHNIFCQMVINHRKKKQTTSFQIWVGSWDRLIYK